MSNIIFFLFRCLLTVLELLLYKKRLNAGKLQFPYMYAHMYIYVCIHVCMIVKSVKAVMLIKDIL